MLACYKLNVFNVDKVDEIELSLLIICAVLDANKDHAQKKTNTNHIKAIKREI